MGEFIGQLLGEGRQPRVMLDYSGTLLHGMRQMGLDDVFDALGYLTGDPRARQAVEWLGCTWGHAVAPSTPPQDFRLHVRAWQHHFAAIFGLEALGRVRGFSPAEMALPNHPDVACAFVRTLADCGYQWVLVQEHTVEQPGGRPVEHPHLPHRLVCTDLPFVPDALQRDGPRLRQGRGLLIGHPGRYSRQGALRNAHVLRQAAHMAEDVGKHVFAQPEQRRVAARPQRPHFRGKGP